MRSFFLTCFVLACAWISTSTAHAASSQSELDRAMSPYSSAVKMALADAPGTAAPAAVKVMDLNRESSACRSLRIQMDRARTAEPTQNNFVPRLSREGGYTSGIPRNSPYGEAGRLESQYLNECR
ncbi:hypothetical protein [Herbaspirillum robiniae]|uniref:Uncharacterized protein n=1 Tax=Herbaspirillum robiniae TaxID=2014887 RepID=A0ABX2M8Y4_9BURK|nr:hypothetical protein [Herbaspirillum robiniae]NUU04284.1 hypothetical protein [Herbaspirillum robiniae]